MWQSKNGKGLYALLSHDITEYGIAINTNLNIIFRRNPNKRPVIVFDGGTLAFANVLCVSNGQYYSGELNKFDDMLQNWHTKLMDLDVLLVFFNTWGVENHKVDGFIDLERKRFEQCIQFYDWIDEGRSASNIFNECVDIRRNLEYSMMVNFKSIMSKYAEHKLCGVGRDVDQQIANYATVNDVLAIFSSDTDFMIFDGNWKFWSFVDIDLDRFTVKEFDRLMLNQQLLLTFEQRPLFASLIGNNYTYKYIDELRRFHSSLWGNGREFFRVAKYIREIFNEQNFTLDDIDEIADVVAHDIFGDDCDDEKRQVIIDSIKSYDINCETMDAKAEQEKDPNAKLRLLNMRWNRAHIHHNINVLQRKQWIFMRDVQQSKRLNDYFTEMVRKQVGLVNPNCIDGTFT